MSKRVSSVVSGAGSVSSNASEKARAKLKKKRDKVHKRTKKFLRRQNAIDLTDMENRLYEMQERAEENGLDSIMADYDPSKLQKKMQ